MMQKTRIVIIIFNILGICYTGYNIVANSIRLATGAPNCTHVLGRDIAFWSILSLLSMVGLTLAIFHQLETLRIIYMSILTILVILSVILVGFFAFAPRVSGSHLNEGELKLEIYRDWFKDYLVNNKAWASFKGCMEKQNICLKERRRTDSTNDPIEIACCKPPKSCEIHLNSTTSSWVPKKNGTKPTAGDCTTWSEQENKLCYDCDLCKAAYIHEYEDNWSFLDMMLFLYAVFFITCFSHEIPKNYQKNNDNGDPRVSV